MHVAGTNCGGELEFLDQTLCQCYCHILLREQKLKVNLCISVVLPEVLQS
jgi:hypothetical protein